MTDSDRKVDSTNTVPGAEKADGSSSVTVLWVDHSQSIRQSACACLVAAGYKVITAENGFEALSKVINQKPAVVITEIMMPRLDGYQLCALVKGNPDFASTSVVMLSGRDAIYDAERAELVGVDHCLSKPFSEQSLLAVVQQQAGRPQPAVETEDAL